MRRRVTRAEENIGDDVDTARRVALDALNMMEVDIPVPFSRDVESSDGGRCAFAPLVFATLLGNAMDVKPSAEIFSQGANGGRPATR